MYKVLRNFTKKAKLCYGWAHSFYQQSHKRNIVPLNFNQGFWLVDLWRSRWFQPFTQKTSNLAATHVTWCQRRNVIDAERLREAGASEREKIFKSCGEKWSEIWPNSLIARVKSERTTCVKILLSFLSN